MYCMYQGIQCKLSNYCFRMLQNIGYHICLVYWSLIRRVQLVDQELLTLPEHLSPSRAFSGVRVTPSLLLCVCFVDRCLSFCPSSFGHCVVYSSSFDHCVVCSSSFGHCVVYSSSFGHCVVYSSSFGHCVVYSSSFDHCVVYSSSIYGFCLPLWYLQTVVNV